MIKLRDFFAELKRRNVYKVAVAYGIVAWLLIQNWAVRLVVLFRGVGTDRRDVPPDDTNEPAGRRSATSLPVLDKWIAVPPFEKLNEHDGS